MASITSLLSRSLLLATAGHVNHGKSTLVERLTGIHPDRLPEEKKRGTTLDLGFAHGDKISFIDCPGHEGLVRHLIAGHRGVDGALFVVAANEGLQEQSREHARILKWLGVTQVLVVITKIDLIEDSNELEIHSKKIMGDLREYFGQDVDLDKIYSSKNQNSEPILKKIIEFIKPKDLLSSESAGARFFIDRAFTIQGTGTVITGTLSEGQLLKSQKVFLWSPSKPKLKPITIKSLRRDKTSLNECKEKSRLACHIDGASPDEIPRGSCLLSSDDDDEITQNFNLEISWVVPTKKQFTATVQVGTLSHEASLKLHPDGYWRARAQRPLPLRKGDKVILRVPNRIKSVGHSIGGGIILAPQTRTVESKLPQKSQLAPRESAPLDQSLLHSLFMAKWEANVEPAQLDRAHALVRAGLAYNIKEKLFIHETHYKLLLQWLNEHFEKKSTLTIEDARSFFGTGRKTFLKILEFCDRLQFTFRKDDVRKKFRLPPYSRPVGGRQDSGHEGGKPSDHLPC